LLLLVDKHLHLPSSIQFDEIRFFGAVVLGQHPRRSKLPSKA
jgi:hypothetical protein